MIVVTHRHHHHLDLKNMGQDMATTAEEATVKPPTKRIRLQCQYPLLLVDHLKPTIRMAIITLIIIRKRHHSRHPRDIIIIIIQKRRLKVEVGGRVVPSITSIVMIITIRGLLLQNLVTTLLGHPLFSQLFSQVHHQCLIIALKVTRVHTLLTGSLFLLTEILILPIEVTTTHKIRWMHLFHQDRIMREGVILLIAEQKPIHLDPLYQITTTALTRDRPPLLYRADPAAIMLLLHDIIMQKIVVVNLRQGLRFSKKSSKQPT